MTSSSKLFGVLLIGISIGTLALALFYSNFGTQVTECQCDPGKNVHATVLDGKASQQPADNISADVDFSQTSEAMTSQRSRFPDFDAPHSVHHPSNINEKVVLVETIQGLSKETKRTLMAALFKLPSGTFVHETELDEAFELLLDNFLSPGKTSRDTVPEITFLGTLGDDGTQQRVFGQGSGRIVNMFDTAGAYSDHVVVLWKNETIGEILDFRAYAIDLARNTNYVWMERDQWDPGEYSVTVLDPIAGRVIAYGRYDVW